jgi:plastocyanin
VEQVNIGKNGDGYFYAPGNVSIPVGGKVVWANKDDEDHDVQSGTPVACDGIFCSGTIAPGSAYSFTFTSPGSYPYFCLIHPGLMSGTITITDE